jgi:GntR family transcriptional regulator
MTTFAWVAVAEQIRHDIHHGRTGPNGELDTEAEMGRRFGTSRITIRRALAELRSEGLVVSQRGSGSRAVLSSRPPVSVVIGAGQIAPNDLTLNRTEVRWRTLRPTGDLVAALRRAGHAKPPQGTWLRLTYVQRVSGTIFDEASVWFAPHVVPFVSREVVATGPTAQTIERAGVPLGPAIQHVSASWNEGRSQRGEPPSEAVDLVLERVMRTATDDIAFVSIHRHRSSLASFRIDLPTSNQSGNERFVLSTI